MKNIFIFPCGSEIALEISRSLKGNSHFHLIGGTSIKDNGEYMYKDIIRNLPWEDSPDFIFAIKKLVTERKIDLIYPTMDSTIVILKKAESYLGVPVISSSVETAEICLSKQRTYEALKDVITVPQIFSRDKATHFPLFVKPTTGYSSKGTQKINSKEELDIYLTKNTNAIICEYLPGEEYTVDCFSNNCGKLLYVGARIRVKTTNGISSYTHPVPIEFKEEFRLLAEKINQKLYFQGAWFYQVKRNINSNLVLLEIASRFGGSSSLNRGLGINFATLSIWSALNHDVSIIANTFPIELNRSFSTNFYLDIVFNEIFLDYDDTLLMNNNRINSSVFQFVIECRNYNIKVTLISRHKGNLIEDLTSRHLFPFFDRILHLKKGELKSKFIDNKESIFIDDSFAERKDVLENCKIPVFSLDMIDALLERIAR